MTNQAHKRRRAARIKKAKNLWHNNVPLSVSRGKPAPQKMTDFVIKEEAKIAAFRKRR